MLMICHLLACFPGDMWAIMSQSWSWVRTKLGFLSNVYAGNICQSWQKRLSWKKLERNFLFDIFLCIWSLFHGKTFPIYVLNLKLQKTFKDSAGATRFRNHMTKVRSQKKNDIIWEFFPNVGPPPTPPFGNPLSKKKF